MRAYHFRISVFCVLCFYTYEVLFCVFLSTASIPTTSKTVGVSSPPYNIGATITTGTASVRSSIQPTSNPPDDGETITTVPVSHNSQPTKSDGAITPVSSNKPPANDGATTTLVIIVVAVVIVLIVIVVGVFILVVILRAKKRKQRLVISKLHSVRTENQDVEMELKHEGTSEREASSSADKPQYSVISTKVPPSVPRKSKELLEYLNQNSTVTCGYSELELEQDHCEHTEPPRVVNISEPLSAEMEPNPKYQNVDQHSSTTNAQQGTDIYNVPDTTSSNTLEADSGTYETVYSEPIQPSLFTDAVETPSDTEDLQPYGPIYTFPTALPKSEEGPLKVFHNNIQEIHELGKGIFGKVILAETVGLSAKDLRLSESDDKSKSTLVAVKKLKSGASNATKVAFEKEVKFMSRLTDRNVIHILGVCYEDTPFIMMEYMEKGDLKTTW